MIIGNTVFKNNDVQKLLLTLKNDKNPKKFKVQNFFLLKVVLLYFKIQKLFLKAYLIYPTLCANLEFERNRAIGTFENIFHRFNNESGSVCFISKYILSLSFQQL